MPDEPEVAPGSPLSPPPPGTPRKRARPPPGSDSEHDSGFSDSGSEHLGRCEGTDPEEPPGPGHAPPGPQAPGAARDPRPLLLLLRPPPAAVPGADGNPRCPPVPPGVPAELSPCPRRSALLRSPPVAIPGPEGTPRCPPVAPELSPCPHRSALLAALALRTGALLRHNRRTQGDIATLRRHATLLARASRDPRVWPRLCHLLGHPAGATGRHREPPGAGGE
ncbi:basic proline-rich protein-like [Molothrus aeneus]|uniref:basic proline-rich protein-like n=1 Tax=Molothrus aeneus TaxID=84833 RepID=UPI003459D658